MKSTLILGLLVTLGFGLHLQANDSAPEEPEVRYYINDAVSNYIYGENGVENYFDSITKYSNVIKCPITTPFTADGSECFQCTVETPIFDLTQMKCVSCPEESTGFANHECVLEV